MLWRFSDCNICALPVLTTLSLVRQVSPKNKTVAGNSESFCAKSNWPSERFMHAETSTTFRAEYQVQMKPIYGETPHRCNIWFPVTHVRKLHSRPTLRLVNLKDPVSRNRQSMFVKVVWCEQQYFGYCSWYILCAWRSLPPAQP